MRTITDEDGSGEHEFLTDLALCQQRRTTDGHGNVVVTSGSV